MKKTTETPDKRCPQCGKTENQAKKGFNKSGTQKAFCKECGAYYTINPKHRAYPEETRKLAVKIYYSGVSGRGVGKVLGMSKADVYNRIKKTAEILEDNYQISESGELYRFLERKARSKTRENVYVMTAVSRKPRQIVGFDVARDKSAKRTQATVDAAPEAKKYCTDGYFGYLDTVFPGRHVYDVHDKRDTFTARA